MKKFINQINTYPWFQKIFRAEASNKIGNIISAFQKMQQSKKWKNLVTQNRRKKLKAIQEKVKIL